MLNPLALQGFKVLDLAAGGACLCGKLLGDLGADVIKLERPGGDISRNIGPFYKGIVHPERSLFWFAYNANKRGITLDIESADGKEVFKRLASHADFVIETFPVGYLDGLGLGYEDLSRLNSRLVFVSITPFGQSGPKCHHTGSELTEWASCGALYVTGDPDRPPLWMGPVHHASLGAAQEAAVGALVAHWHRQKTGEGQRVDVSIQESGIQVLQALVGMWDVARMNYVRTGDRWLAGTGLRRRAVYECKDGFVSFLVLGGAKREAASSKAFVDWMAEDKMAPGWLLTIDWVNDYAVSKLSQAEVDRVEKVFSQFIVTKTKEELFQRALTGGIMLAPISTTRDVCESPQLKARHFWTKFQHPELDGDWLTYPGSFVKFGETPCPMRRRAPLIGEHNEEVYVRELGYSREQLVALKQVAVI